MSKPVEVWVVLFQETIKGCSFVCEAYAWEDVGEIKGKEGYRCERRLIVKEGETFADGVEACIEWLKGTPTTEDGTMILSHAFIIENLRALSPAPENEVDYKSMYQSLLADHAREIESADKLLREIASIWRPAAGEYNRLLERLDAYLKGKA